MKIFHREEKEKEEAKFEVKYISGHSMYPYEKGTHVLFFADRLELEHMNIVIPYADIKRLGSQEDRHTTKTRVFWTTPIVGLLWKKKYRYTVIEYFDGIQDQTILIDFHRSAEKVQKGLYQNMIDARKKKEGKTAEEVKTFEKEQLDNKLQSRAILCSQCKKAIGWATDNDMSIEGFYCEDCSKESMKRGWGDDE
jgi:hypothetical protein